MAASESKNLMTEGSIPKKIIGFAMPLFLGNLFQQLYNTADSLIVGNFLGSEALAAVSSSGNLIFLMTGFFNGIAMGAGVVVARFYGARDKESVHEAVHTTVAFGLIAGIFLTIFGMIMAPIFLKWMGTPENVLPQSTEYFRLYFLGSLGLIMYNIFVGILQATGDSKHPLYYLIISSIINVVLDIVFITVFDMGVGSAAIATAIAQFVSAILCMIQLMRTKEEFGLRLKDIKINVPMLRLIVNYGVPSGLQNSVIAIANVVVQSNINSFGDMAMAGCGAYSKIEGFAFLPITSFTMAITTFVGQNLGARAGERARKGAKFGMACSMGLAETIGVLVFVFAPYLIGMFNNEPEVVNYGVMRAQCNALFYFLLAYSHCSSAILRGAGKSKIPMFVMLVCWCAIRVTILTIFVPLLNDIRVVNWVYPITWTLSSSFFLWYTHKYDWTRSDI